MERGEWRLGKAWLREREDKTQMPVTYMGRMGGVADGSSKGRGCVRGNPKSHLADFVFFGDFFRIAFLTCGTPADTRGHPPTSVLRRYFSFPDGLADRTKAARNGSKTIENKH